MHWCVCVFIFQQLKAIVIMALVRFALIACRMRSHTMVMLQKPIRIPMFGMAAACVFGVGDSLVVLVIENVTCLVCWSCFVLL
jgi:hypothetical protein